MALHKMVHFKCRNTVYPFSKIQRLFVHDQAVSWQIPLEKYDPPEYNSPNLTNKPWADLDINDPKFVPKWNQLDGNINRISHMEVYDVIDKRPINPIGRTGLIGRGVLGKWGPNHAADPIVTRWKTVDNKKVYDETNKLPILQFCAIQRQDCNEWAIPGGMVDPGEQVNQTLMREFLEEAFNTLEKNDEEVKRDETMVKDFFKCGDEIYRGYVDDPRNTDNAWMETIAVNFHDDAGELVGKFQLRAGDDAKNVKWIDINEKLNLYASHLDLIKSVAMKRKAHW